MHARSNATTKQRRSGAIGSLPRDAKNSRRMRPQGMLSSASHLSSRLGQTRARAHCRAREPPVQGPIALQNDQKCNLLVGRGPRSIYHCSHAHSRATTEQRRGGAAASLPRDEERERFDKNAAAGDSF
eukprot:7020066-Pyramimonas_sp.AAC.1